MDRMKCPGCGSADTTWRGYRRNRVRDKRLRFCRSCGRKFTPDDGYLRMRFNPGVIKEALRLRSRGFSTSEVRLNLQRHEGVRVSRWTIIKWERKFKKKR
jgi:transposase-like protein